MKLKKLNTMAESHFTLMADLEAKEKYNINI